MTATPHPIRIAVDIGGTFTDIEVFDARTGAASAHKTPTTPDDPSRGLANGLKEAGERFGFTLDQIGILLHGTTIATNAVLERKLPKGAMLTTAGFEDVLEIGRHMRKSLYALKAEPRSLLIPRERRFGVKERVRYDGAVEAPLDLAGVRDVAKRLVDDGVEALAIGFLNAYANPAHEAAALTAVADAAPGLAVSASHEISPEVREFERFSTTVLNALLKPVVSRYLEQVESRLAAVGVAAPLYLVQSNGGVAKPADAARLPAKLLLSGPAGGAMAMASLAARHGVRNLVGIDMGGTSADIAVVADGAVGSAPEGDIDGLPVRLPMIEIRTIGAGGGSIARVEAGGLRVGPESAGADPGPVCYGRGGDTPAVTDANVALARIDAGAFLGGDMTLDAAGAAQAISASVATPLDLTAEAAASGVLEVADAHMADAIRLSLFEKGADPADFALAPFGGAGGLHAGAIAEALDIRRIVFPTNASTLSARGILGADLRHDLARSRRLTANQGGEERALNEIREIVRDLRAEAVAALDRDAVAPADRSLLLQADMRYLGQAYELTIPWLDLAEGETLDGDALSGLVDRFHAEHLQRFAHADKGDTVEIATLRLAAVGRMPNPELAESASAMAGPGEPVAHRRVWLSDRWRETPVYRRTTLGAGAAISGPCVVEEDFTTLIVPEGWRAQMTASGDLIAERTAP